MAPPDRDTVEEDVLEEEITRVVKGLLDAGVIFFATIFDLRSSSLRL